MTKYFYEEFESDFAGNTGNALYRPGPMDYIPQFIRRKNGQEKITYDIPCMEKYLKDTYGITVSEKEYLARISSIFNAISCALVPILSLSIAFISKTANILSIFFIFGFVFIALFILLFRRSV